MVPERFSPGASGISSAGGCEVFNGSVSSRCGGAGGAHDTDSPGRWGAAEGTGVGDFIFRNEESIPH